MLTSILFSFGGRIEKPLVSLSFSVSLTVCFSCTFDAVLMGCKKMFLPGTLLCNQLCGPALWGLGCVISPLLCLVPWLVASAESEKTHFTQQAAATQQMRPVIQPPYVGHNTTCQVKVCILGESLPVQCFYHRSQQGGQTEEWAANSWRETGSGNLLLWFFTGRIRKKRQHLLANSDIKCSLQELCMKRSWKDFDCSWRKETKKR